jgi:hypothetical protein
VTAKTAAPLPECRLCEAPTKRETWEANGELCTPCTQIVADTVRMLPVRSGPPMDDRTIYVERYRPPVPGTEGRHRDR